MNRKLIKDKNETLLLIVLAFVALSAGTWSKYRQLWLQEAGYSITEISKILSVALICSGVIAFVISLFSTRIRVKNIVVLSFIIKIISMISLLVFKSDYIIKTCILLSIMCDIIFSISYFPLLSFESKRAYKKKMLVDFLFNDIGVVACGLLLGVTFGHIVFNYDWCLIVSIISQLLAFLFIMPVNSSQTHRKRTKTFMASLKEIVSDKINRVFLAKELIGYIAYGILFDLMMLILTNYIGFDVSFAAIFIIVSNVFGTIFTFLFSKVSTNFSISLSCFIKYGTRAIIFFIAFLMNDIIVFIFALIYAYITSRILEDKATGAFLEIISPDNQFLYGNVRYFILCIGEGIGAFLAGVLLSKSLRILFLGVGIFIGVVTLVSFYLDKLKKECKKS